jgi:hypothetical protein
MVRTTILATKVGNKKKKKKRWTSLSLAILLATE